MHNFISKRPFFSIIFLLCALFPLPPDAQDFFSPHWQAIEQHRHDPVLPDLLDSDNMAPMPLALSKAPYQENVVFGYLPWWIEKEYYENIDFDLLTHISAFSAEVNPDGSIAEDHGWPWTGLINRAHASGVRVVLTMTLFGDTNVLTLLENSVSRERFFQEVHDRLRVSNADGVNIDFEGPGANGWPSLINGFMADLTTYLHNEFPGCEVSFAAPPVDWGQRWDYVGLAESCDYLFVMGYAFSGSWSERTGPTAPLTGGSRNISTTLSGDFGAVTRTTPEKLILGVPYYGCQWRTDIPDPRASTIEFIRHPRIATTFEDLPDRDRLWDEISSTPWYRYKDGQRWMQVWYDDPQSLALKYNLAVEHGLKGVGMWALGYEGQRRELWDLLQELFGRRPHTTWVTSTQQPVSFDVAPNYPNPFNRVTSIKYALPSTGLLEISIYDISGQLLQFWRQDQMSPGTYQWNWDGRNRRGVSVGSGMYFCSMRFASLEGDEQLRTQRMLLLR